MKIHLKCKTCGATRRDLVEDDVLLRLLCLFRAAVKAPMVCRSCGARDSLSPVAAPPVKA